MMRLWAGALLALLACDARAQDGAALTGTLQTIHARGTILIGVRSGAVPFAFKNLAGEPVGFSVDLCNQIAGDIAALLHRDLLEPGTASWEQGIRVDYVTVTPDERLPSLLSGAIDLECGSTTATAERAKTVAFSPVFFMAGTKLLAPFSGQTPAVTSYHDLAGRRVGVSTGTTNADVLRRLGPTLSPPMTILAVPGLTAAYDLLAAGKVDALASDDVLLAGLAATHADGRRFAVVGDYLSFEPYAVMFRRDDPALAALVRASFGRMAADGILTARYRRWFNTALPSGQTLALPMSAELAEIYRGLGEPD